MKLRLLFLSALIIGTLASFTLNKSAATGSLKIQIELPAGSKTGLEYAPIGLSKTKEDLDNGDYITEIFTTSTGMADFGQIEAGTYFVDGFTSSEEEEAGFWGKMEVQVVAGKANVYTLKLIAEEPYDESGEE